MTAIRLNPLSDVVFSCIFQDMSGAPAMKELINAVLTGAGDEPIAEVVDMHSQYSQLSDKPEGKSGRLDVKVRTASNEFYDVEVQLNADNFFVARELFYGEAMSLRDFKSGDTYQDLPSTRVIAFLDFVLRENNSDIVQPIKPVYTKEPIEIATDKIAFYNVEIPKFKSQYNSIDDVKCDNPLNEWLYMLTKGYRDEEEMNMLKEKTDGMANFTALYTSAIADERLRDRYEYEMSQRLEEKSRLRAAREKGMAQGEERLARLIGKLLSAGDTAGVSLAASNAVERERLFRKYNIT